MPVWFENKSDNQTAIWRPPEGMHTHTHTPVSLSEASLEIASIINIGKYGQEWSQAGSHSIGQFVCRKLASRLTGRGVFRVY